MNDSMNIFDRRGLNYSDPDSMTKEQLLEWAKANFNHWLGAGDVADGVVGSRQPSWYILFLWGERE